MTTLVDPRDLALTYDPPTYPDGWTAVLDYEATMRYASHRPNKGSAAIASALDLPRGRVRTWLDGGKPDAARAIETADAYGWIDLDYGDTKFYALNALVANVFSGGSIEQTNYVPSFALTRDQDESRVVDVLDDAGVDYEFFHEDSDERATEIRPTTDASVLGRVLMTLGAPIGPKKDRTDLSLPWYLDDAPLLIRKRFVEAYLANRGHYQNGIVKLREERSDAYLRELAALIEDVADGPVTISEMNVMLSTEATEQLGFR
ncbi:hypothetical protein [Halovivax gelatinilyticus]|uniref:hypothetical protein n=1 Tax=Halovivax gelatinilyticus TaxID=2961597 RepID=UPI0020CA4B9F|nr:hypothetical protein [Halovivax gelatinilyticus]